MKYGEHSERRSEDSSDSHAANDDPGHDSAGMSRRSFLQAGALATGGAALAPLSKADAQAGDVTGDVDAQNLHALSGDHRDIAGASIAEMQALMSSRRLSSQELVDIYLRRITLIDMRLPLAARAA